MNTIQSKDEEGETLPEIEMDIDMFRDMLKDVGECSEDELHTMFNILQKEDYAWFGRYVVGIIKDNFEEYKERCK